MSIRPFTEEDVLAAAMKHGAAIPLDLRPEYPISLLLRPFTQATFGAHLEAELRNAEDAREGLLFTACLFHSAAEIKWARAHCQELPEIVLNALSEDAGYPINAPAGKITSDLGSATPALLSLAGLTEEAAGKLRDERPDTKLLLVVVKGQDGEPIFAAVLTPAGSAEAAVIRKARETKKGAEPLFRSAVAGCTAWSSVPPEEAFKTWPVLATMVLLPLIESMGVDSSARTFRRVGRGR
ncbi:MAG: hypothetical protein ABI193_12735 [Minicystis sp.]